MKIRPMHLPSVGRSHGEDQNNHGYNQAERMRASGPGVAASNCASGFTLVETVIAVLVATVMLTALYACFACGWSLIKITDQDLRATQIVLQRMERVRLCNFTQVKDTGLNPSTSLEYYDPKDQPNGGGGVAYTVTYSNATPAAGSLPEAYRTNMLLVTVGASWTNGTKAYNRSMQTFVARDGMQPYISSGQ
jgi:Tfp pilus assembly protein PilE